MIDVFEVINTFINYKKNIMITTDRQKGKSYIINTIIEHIGKTNKNAHILLVVANIQLGYEFTHFKNVTILIPKTLQTIKYFVDLYDYLIIDNIDICASINDLDMLELINLFNEHNKNVLLTGTINTNKYDLTFMFSECNDKNKWIVFKDICEDYSYSMINIFKRIFK